MRWAKSHPRLDILLQLYECRRVKDVPMFEVVGHPEPVFHGSWIVTHRILMREHKQVAIHTIQVCIARIKRVINLSGHTATTPFRNGLREHTKIELEGAQFL